MMAEIVNLRRARKHKARAADEARAEANRRHFGTPKAERLQRTAEEQRAERAHEGHKLEREKE
jgi:hypothetical protein